MSVLYLIVFFSSSCGNCDGPWCFNFGLVEEICDKLNLSHYVLSCCFQFFCLILKTSYLTCLQGQSVAWHLLNKYRQYFLGGMSPFKTWPLCSWQWCFLGHQEVHSDKLHFIGFYAITRFAPLGTSEALVAINMIPPSLIHPNMSESMTFSMLFILCVCFFSVAGAVWLLSHVSHSLIPQQRGDGISVVGFSAF